MSGCGFGGTAVRAGWGWAGWAWGLAGLGHWAHCWPLGWLVTGPYYSLLYCSHSPWAGALGTLLRTTHCLAMAHWHHGIPLLPLRSDTPWAGLGYGHGLGCTGLHWAALGCGTGHTAPHYSLPDWQGMALHCTPLRTAAVLPLPGLLAVLLALHSAHPLKRYPEALLAALLAAVLLLRVRVLDAGHGLPALLPAGHAHGLLHLPHCLAGPAVME